MYRCTEIRFRLILFDNKTTETKFKPKYLFEYLKYYRIKYLKNCKRFRFPPKISQGIIHFKLNKFFIYFQQYQYNH